MKVGILVECGRQGLEDVVCRRLCALLQERTDVRFEFDIVPMDDKPRLIRECGTVAARLIADNCDRVVVLWDERPAWPKREDQLCWHKDRRDVRNSLREAEVNEELVHLVCIEREFESWLLFDNQMLSEVLSTDAHRVRIGRQHHPDRMSNPKGRMAHLFRQHRSWRYVDVQHAAAFAQHLNSLNRILRCPTFRRFAERVIGRAVS